jgi:hypothetical protein
MQNVIMSSRFVNNTAQGFPSAAGAESVASFGQINPLQVCCAVLLDGTCHAL